MKILVLCEYVRASPWADSAWARDLAVALALRGHEVVLACDGAEDPERIEPAGLLVRSAPRGMEHREPLAFAAWARRLVRRGEQDASLSLSPCACADVWSPVERTAARYAARIIGRRSPASIAMGLTHSGWLPSAAIAERLAAREGVRTDVAPLARPPAEGGLGFASTLRLVDDSERAALRCRVRSLVGAGEDRFVMIMSGVHHRSPGLEAMLTGLTVISQRHPLRMPLLLVLGPDGYSVHAMARRAGCERHVRLLGGTNRAEAALCAADIGVAPMAGPEGPLTGRFISDCLRFALPVLACRDAAGAELLHPPAFGTASIGLVVDPATPTGWADAMEQMLDPTSHRHCADAARSMSGTLSMDALLDRLEHRLRKAAARR